MVQVLSPVALRHESRSLLPWGCNIHSVRNFSCSMQPLKLQQQRTKPHKIRNTPGGLHIPLQRAWLLGCYSPCPETVGGFQESRLILVDSEA